MFFGFCYNTTASFISVVAGSTENPRMSSRRPREPSRSPLRRPERPPEPPGHRQEGHCHRRLLILRGAVFGQVLPHGDAGKRILSIREAIERRFRLFTLAVREGHLELLGFGSRVQARIRVRRLTKLRLLHLQLQLI